MASLLKNLGTIAPCLLAITVDSLGFGLVYPILTMMFAGTHRTFLGPGVPAAEADFLFGLDYMLYPAGMFFGASLLGDLSDRVGRKRLLLVCMGGLSVATALMATGIVLRSAALLLFGRFPSGLMAGSQPIAQAAVSDLSPESQRVLNMSLLALALSAFATRRRPGVDADRRWHPGSRGRGAIDGGPVAAVAKTAAAPTGD
jgi:MFS transporter, DHA1 family, tetracycline resistance protein